MSLLSLLRFYCCLADRVDSGAPAVSLPPIFYLTGEQEDERPSFHFTTHVFRKTTTGGITIQILHKTEM